MFIEILLQEWTELKMMWLDLLKLRLREANKYMFMVPPLKVINCYNISG